MVASSVDCSPMAPPRSRWTWYAFATNSHSRRLAAWPRSEQCAAKDAVSYSATYMREHLKYIEAISNPSVLEISDGVSDETMALRKLLNQT